MSTVQTFFFSAIILPFSTGCGHKAITLLFVLAVANSPLLLNATACCGRSCKTNMYIHVYEGHVRTYTIKQHSYSTTCKYVNLPLWIPSHPCQLPQSSSSGLPWCPQHVQLSSQSTSSASIHQLRILDE